MGKVDGLVVAYIQRIGITRLDYVYPNRHALGAIIGDRPSYHRLPTRSVG